MDAEVKRKWVAALRSGDYEQGRGALKYQGELDETPRFCCLGVLLDVMGEPDTGSNPYTSGDGTLTTYWSFGGAGELAKLTPALSAKFGLSLSEQDELVVMNDAQRRNFNEIADYIEEAL